MFVKPLVSVAETKNALRIDDDDLINDANIQALIAAASDQVAAYLKKTRIETDDGLFMDLTADPPVVPPQVKQATIMLVGFLYKAPDDNPNKEWTHGFLPQPIMSLLYQLRDPALA